MAKFHLLSFYCLLSAATVFAWNPNNNYVPTRIECPSRSSFITRGHELSTNESDWVEARHAVTDPILIEFLNRMNMTDFDASTFLSNVSLNIGLAFSEGGYRAMLCGAGQLAALDNRTRGATSKGHLGGLLQASTYIAGVSGGDWMINSVVLNNFTTIEHLQEDKDLWNLTKSIHFAGLNANESRVYYTNLISDIHDKRDAGFNISITDIWARVLSQQFIGLKNGGPALQYSDIRNFDPFVNHEMPFPISLSNGRAPGTQIDYMNSTVFETTPFYLGSWDPSLFAFTDTYYLGSNVSNGIPYNQTSCVTGFDNAGFVMATSSSVYNRMIGELRLATGYEDLYNILEEFMANLDDPESYSDLDISVYAPNPFLAVTNASSIADSEFLSLVDGSADNQRVALNPLQQEARGLDVIFAYDNTVDTNYGWPAGMSIRATYERQFGSQGNHSLFPSVPDINTFLNHGLNTRPVFFGCYANNFTELRSRTGASDDYVPPLIVYTSNYPYSFYSNMSSFQTVFTTEEISGVIENGYNVATQGNSTYDAEWGACVGCAIIQRELERRNQSQTEQCQQCFSRYCWDGSLNTQLPQQSSYMPSLKLANSASSMLPFSKTVLWAAFACVIFVI